MSAIAGTTGDVNEGSPGVATRGREPQRNSISASVLSLIVSCLSSIHDTGLTYSRFTDI